MKKNWLCALAVVGIAACGGGGGSSTTTVSGFTVDIDKLSQYLAMNPSASDPTTVIMNSCVPNTPVYALYADGSQSETVMADANCDYTVTVKENTTVHMVAATSTANMVANTYSQDLTTIGTTPVTNIPAHVCTSKSYSAPSGVAAKLAIGFDTMVANGICMFGTNDVFTAPFVKLTPSTITVTQTGWTVYALTDPTTTPPTFVQQAASPIGIYGIYNTANTAETSITVNATATSGTNTYAPFTCDVKPGFVTFGPENPN